MHLLTSQHILNVQQYSFIIPNSIFQVRRFHVNKQHCFPLIRMGSYLESAYYGRSSESRYNDIRHLTSAGEPGERWDCVCFGLHAVHRSNIEAWGGVKMIVCSTTTPCGKSIQVLVQMLSVFLCNISGQLDTCASYYPHDDFQYLQGCCAKEQKIKCAATLSFSCFK